jgi:hypothetical protein
VHFTGQLCGERRDEEGRGWRCSMQMKQVCVWKKLEKKCVRLRAKEAVLKSSNP